MLLVLAKTEIAAENLLSSFVQAKEMSNCFYSSYRSY